MSYVIAAYGLVVVSLLGYGVHLSRERRALCKALSPQGNRDHG